MKNRFFQLFIFTIIILFVAKGSRAIIYAQEAMKLCYEMIIPTLFPFFVCSGLLIYSGFCETLSKIFAPVMKPLFNVNPSGSVAFILGIISGYPLGAVTVCNLYEGFYISKSEAERLLGFCNNSGPLFILASVGIGLYSGLKVGIMLYLVHIVSAILVGCFMRFYKKNDFAAPKSEITTRENTPLAGFGEVLENSVKSILNICGSVMLFSVVSRLFLDFFKLDDIAVSFISGILEITSGTARIATLDVDFFYKMIMSSFIVGFAGISVLIQVLGVVSKHGLSLKPYIFGKLLHGVISAVLMCGGLLVLPKIRTFKEISFGGGFVIGSLSMIISIVVFVLCGILFAKKAKNKVNTSL